MKLGMQLDDQKVFLCIKVLKPKNFEQFLALNNYSCFKLLNII